MRQEESEMKATLEFDLPEAEAQLKNALDGGKWRAVVEDLAQELRNKIKYGELTQERADAYAEMRDYLYESMEDLNLFFE
jgi:hypothetical protein